MSTSRRFMAVGGAALTLAATACSSSNKVTSPTSLDLNGSSSTSSTTASPTGSGAVTVFYAGSLVNLMEKQIGPAFKSATGYSLTGYSAGSTALATQIKGKIHAGDVFISASPKVNDSLEGDANGNWVSWYATFASSPLVLGYNPASKFAADIMSKPWYQAISESGILIGRTDPATDPKGALTVTALNTAATAQNLPALKTLATATSNVFPEETLVGRLQSGQLDAGFFYSSEATAAKIATVPITGQSLKATYTVTILNNAPNETGAEAFVQFLLGATGQSTLTSDGFQLASPPTVSGSGVPSSLQAILPASSAATTTTTAEPGASAVSSTTSTTVAASTTTPTS